MSIVYNVVAQAPQKMSYQAVIRDVSNVLIINHSIGMRISILQGSVAGTPVYVETQTPNTNANGLVSLEIGGGTIVTGTFANINWSSATYYIKTETDPTGGANYTITATSQILSVPYALNARSVTGMVNANNGIVSNVATPINNTDAANKAYVDALSDKMMQLFAELGAKDVEGNNYKSVKIGNQVWMAENLKSTKYNDNTSIPLVSDNTTWSTLSTPGYCWYNNDEATNKSIYGAMYNWYAVNTGKLCPTGWHVPTNTEWTTLITYLGGVDIAGGKLKETGTSHWLSPNTSTNESGFTGLPGGYRVYAGNFNVIGDFGCWWTSTEIDGPSANYVSLRYFANYVNRFGSGKEGGFSVRCLRDN